MCTYYTQLHMSICIVLCICICICVCVCWQTCDVESSLPFPSTCLLFLSLTSLPGVCKPSHPLNEGPVFCLQTHVLDQKLHTTFVCVYTFICMHIYLPLSLQPIFLSANFRLWKGCGKTTVRFSNRERR